MSTKQLKQHRQQAYQLQSGFCFYCGKPTWLSSPEEFAKRLKITPAQASHYQCSAEHLVPRQDGGKDSADNIVAACILCNRQRHRLRKPLPPDRFKGYVHKRVVRNRWPTAKFLSNKTC